MFPIVYNDPAYSYRTLTQRINYKGVITQCMIEQKEHSEYFDSETREMKIQVKVNRSLDPNYVAPENTGFFSFGNILPEESRESTEKYRLVFDSKNLKAKMDVL